MRKNFKKVYVTAPTRTPIGKFGGILSSMTAPELGAIAARASIERAGINPTQIDELIFGNARQAGVGPNPARQIAFQSGCPETVPAYTVNKACASGMKTITNAYQAIVVGDAVIEESGVNAAHPRGRRPGEQRNRRVVGEENLRLRRTGCRDYERRDGLSCRRDRGERNTLLPNLDLTVPGNQAHLEKVFGFGWPVEDIDQDRRCRPRRLDAGLAAAGIPIHRT